MHLSSSKFCYHRWQLWLLWKWWWQLRQSLHLYYLLSPLLVGPSSLHSSNDGWDLILSSIAHTTQMGLTWFWDLTQLLELGLIWLPLQWLIRLQTMILASTHIHSRRKWEPLDQILRKYGKVLLLHWNCFSLHHLCWMPEYVSLFSCIVWFASVSLLVLSH